MSSSSSKVVDMKDFYRQKKVSAAKKTTKSSPKQSHSAADILVSSVTQPSLYIYDHDDVKEEEMLLRQFDMNMAYGPCLGMSRLARWERANKLGMNPSPDVERLLKLPQARLDCLWEGRV